MENGTVTSATLIPFATPPKLKDVDEVRWPATDGVAVFPSNFGKLFARSLRDHRQYMTARACSFGTSIALSRRLAVVQSLAREGTAADTFEVVF
jgi:hypothetical protein